MAKYHHFTVEGVGSFPVDMLRLDQCWPRASEDSLAVAAMFATGSLRKVRVTGLSAPTMERWRSFGWKVVTPPAS